MKYCASNPVKVYRFYTEEGKKSFIHYTQEKEYGRYCFESLPLSAEVQIYDDHAIETLAVYDPEDFKKNRKIYMRQHRSKYPDCINPYASKTVEPKKRENPIVSRKSRKANPAKLTAPLKSCLKNKEPEIFPERSPAEIEAIIKQAQQRLAEIKKKRIN